MTEVEVIENRLCKGCQHQNACEDVYRRLGHSTGPAVTQQVLVAFVGPMLVFVAALAGARQLWSCLVYPKVITLASFLTALAGAALWAAGGAWWLRSACQGQHEKRQNG